MQRVRNTVLFLVILTISVSTFAQQTPDLRVLDDILNTAVEKNQIPGAVAIVGHNGKVIYRKAVGSRSLEPTREAMTLDTVFDMASITKCMATATGVMQLVEQGKVKLNDPVVKYIPEFGANGKENITVRQLATHFSGLREDLDLNFSWQGRQTAYGMAHAEKLVAAPGAEFRYSDINYIMLGELIERVSGMPLEEYTQKNIFGPLGMTHSRYLPLAEWLKVTEPTEYDENNKMLRGNVHDPTARRMGGVAGHAGLFSTADDTARYAQAMLDGKFVLGPAALEKATTPQQPSTSPILRGIGWDIDSPFASNRGELLPVGSFGHTGFTGKSLWVDPTTNTYIVLLVNGVHPRLNARPGSPVLSLRTRFASAVAAAIKLSPSEEQKRRLANITGYSETAPGGRRLLTRNGQVTTGLEVLAPRLDGEPESIRDLCTPRTGSRCRVGLLTNQTGLDSKGRRNIDLLAKSKALELTAIFSPEHGIFGKVDTENVENTKDPVSGLPVYSLYGTGDAKRRPSVEQLKTLDAVIFDIQDAGVRWYTYETTLGYFLEACAKAGVPLIVLDRPNPINAAYVQGPVSDPGTESFVNYHQIPIRHGMTLGEMAQMYNTERNINAKLMVVKMQGFQRGDWFDSTGLPWTNPSPNLRNMNQATLYPGVALVEGTNVSVGRGTDTPFELLGAPWIDAGQLAAYLNARQLAGIRFVPTDYTPIDANATKYPHSGQVCHGVHMLVTDRNLLDAAELGVEIASALLKLYPQQFKAERMPKLLANQSVFEALQRGDDPRIIADSWRESLDRFKAIRAKYLLY